MKKKIIFSLLLVITLSYCLSIFSYAKSISDNQYEVLSMYVNKYSGSFSTSGVTCDMYASINGTPNVTKVNIKLELQKKKDGEKVVGKERFNEYKHLYGQAWGVI